MSKISQLERSRKKKLPQLEGTFHVVKTPTKNLTATNCQFGSCVVYGGEEWAQNSYGESQCHLSKLPNNWGSPLPWE